MEAVSCATDCLDPRHVFLLDAGLRIFVWYGKKCKNVLKSKARLMAEKINKNERKNKAMIHIFCQGDEPHLFWMILQDLASSSLESEDSGALSPCPPAELCEHVPDNWSPVIPRLYSVGLGMGYLGKLYIIIK